MLVDRLRAILNEFNIPHNVYELRQVENGLINKSYAVLDKRSTENLYFLQQIDHHSFHDIEGIMHNIGLVTGHFRGLTKAPGHLTTLQTNLGTNYYHSAGGEYWRLYDYIEGITYHRAENIQIAAEAGKMFGEFQHALKDIDISLMRITIPGFHDINLRYKQFQQSLASANSDRKNKSTLLVELVNKNIKYVKSIYHDVVSTCPSRVTHNDTKLSNLIFDMQHKGICVVDYDTLMPGYLALDFGDSVRTICSTTVEDDQDLKNTCYNLDIYAAFAGSYIMALETSITKQELNMLAKGVVYMPFLMGIRMLTDYLNNDIYYSTRHELHNFDRASNQFTLYRNGVSLLSEMNNIIDAIRV